MPNFSKIIQLSKKLGIINIYLIANKLIDEQQLDVVNELIKDWDVPLFHTIPYDTEIGKADLKAIPPLDYAPDSSAIKSIENLYLKLKELKTTLFDL